MAESDPTRSAISGSEDLVAENAPPANPPQEVADSADTPLNGEANSPLTGDSVGDAPIAGDRPDNADGPEAEAEARANSDDVESAESVEQPEDPIASGEASTEAGSPQFPVIDDQQTVIKKNPPKPTGKPLTTTQEMGRVLEGELLGHFELLEFVGGGGMGAVFRAKDTMLNRIVAVKVLSREQTDSETLRRFRNEAQSAARLDHENIARVFYVGADDGWNYIVFEFIEGENIRDIVATRGPLPVAEAISYTIQVAEALEHAYLRDVVHRDVKPSNVLVMSNGRAKLVDMGLARLHQVEAPEHDLTASGVTLGTFDYISPEQARDPRGADVRSDLYSLGCTLFYMLTGQAPFPEGTVLQKLLRHTSEPPPDPRSLGVDVPQSVVDICNCLLAKLPSHRYQSPSELIEALSFAATNLGMEQTSTGRFKLPTSLQKSHVWQSVLPVVLPVVTLFALVFVIELLLRDPPSSLEASTGSEAASPLWPFEQPILLPSKTADASAEGVPGDTSSDTGNTNNNNESSAADMEDAGGPAAASGTDTNTGTTGDDSSDEPNGSTVDTPATGDADAGAETGMSRGSDTSDLPMETGGVTNGGTRSGDASDPSNPSMPEPEGTVKPANTSPNMVPSENGVMEDPVVPGEMMPSTPTSPRSTESTTQPATSKPDTPPPPAPTETASLSPIALTAIVGGNYSEWEYYDSLSEAIRRSAELAPQDVEIRLRFNGRQPLKPTEVSGGKITIVASAGYSPVLTADWPATAPSSSDEFQSLLSITGGTVELRGVHWEVEPPRNSNPWSVWQVSPAAEADLVRLTVYQSTITVAQRVDRPTSGGGDFLNGSVLEIVNPKPRSEAVSQFPPTIRLEQTVVRSGSKLVGNRNSTPFSLEAIQSFLSSPTLLDIESAKTQNDWDERGEVWLDRVTVLADEGLGKVNRTPDKPYPLALDIQIDHSILLTQGDAPLMEQSGFESMEEASKWITFGGDQNFYPNTTVRWRITSPTLPTRDFPFRANDGSMGDIPWIEERMPRGKLVWDTEPPNQPAQDRLPLDYKLKAHPSNPAKVGTHGCDVRSLPKLPQFVETTSSRSSISSQPTAAE